MAYLRWVLTCQRVITDRESNLVSYIEAVEGMTLPELPHPLLPFVVATLWDREEVGETIHMRIRIIDPAGEVIAELGPAALEP